MTDVQLVCWNEREPNDIVFTSTWSSETAQHTGCNQVDRLSKLTSSGGDTIIGIIVPVWMTLLLNDAKLITNAYRIRIRRKAVNALLQR